MSMLNDGLRPDLDALALDWDEIQMEAEQRLRDGSLDEPGDVQVIMVYVRLSRRYLNHLNGIARNQRRRLREAVYGYGCLGVRDGPRRIGKRKGPKRVELFEARCEKQVG